MGKVCQVSKRSPTSGHFTESGCVIPSLLALSQPSGCRRCTKGCRRCTSGYRRCTKGCRRRTSGTPAGTRGCPRHTSVTSRRTKGRYRHTKGSGAGTKGPRRQSKGASRHTKGTRQRTSEAGRCGEIIIPFIKDGQMGVCVECSIDGGPWVFVTIDTTARPRQNRRDPPLPPLLLGRHTHQRLDHHRRNRLRREHLNRHRSRKNQPQSNRSACSTHAPRFCFPRSGRNPLAEPAGVIHETHAPRYFIASLHPQFEPHPKSQCLRT